MVSLFTGDNFTYGYQNGYWDKDIFALSDNISSVYYFGTVDKNNYFPCMFDEIASTGGGCKIYDSINYYAFNNFDYTDQITIQKFDPHDTHALVTFNTNGGDTANTQIYALKGQMVSEAIPPEKKDCLAVVFCAQTIDKTAYLIDNERQLADIYKPKKMA